MATIERFAEMISWQKARKLNHFAHGSEMRGNKFKKPETNGRTKVTLDIGP